jgi:hypothetical protein
VVLGHVKATTAGPLEAEVEPCDFKGKKAPAGADIPDLARCRVIQQDFGDFRVKLALDKGVTADQAKRVRAALAGMTPEARQLVEVVAEAANADWALQSRGGKLELWSTQGRASVAAAKSAVAPAVPPRPVAEYAADADLASELERDLQRAFTLRNLWRVAGKLSAGAAEQGVTLEVVRLTGKKGKVEGPLASGSAVRSGQYMEMRVANKGLEDLWVTLLFTDSSFSITPKTTVVRAGDKLVQQGPITGKLPGVEGIILLAVPLSVSRDQPNFSFLEQPALGVRGRGLPARIEDTDKAKTPFGQLMAGAGVGKGSRALELDAPTNPAVLSWSWVKVP